VSNAINLIVSAGPHARYDTPVSIDLGDAVKGQTQAKLSETDTARSIPCQLDGTRLFFVVPGLGENEERPLKLELGAESARHGGVKLTDKKEEGLSVEISGKPFTTYRYQPAGEFPVKARPFFYPVYGAGGAGMTRNFPMKDLPGETKDHPHHRGLWVAFGDVNGTDNWSEGPDHGYQTHQRFSEILSGPVCGRFVEELHWEDKAHNKVCEETRTFVTWNLPQDQRLIDLTVSFRANPGPLRFGDTKEGGICSIRVPCSLESGRGRIENAAGGVGEGETWGRAAHWVDYSGIVEGQPLGVAIMDHPFNLRHPTPWHVRSYGLFSANPFAHSYYKASHLQDGSFSVPVGGALTFRYRVYFHRGDRRRGDVAGKWNDYAFAPVVKRAE